MKRNVQLKPVTKQDVEVARTTGFTHQQATTLFARLLYEPEDALYGSTNEEIRHTATLDYQDLLDAHEFYVEHDLAKAIQHTHGEWSDDDRLPFDNVYIRTTFNCPLGIVVGIHLSAGPEEVDGRPAGVPYYEALVLPKEGKYELQTLRGFITDYVSSTPMDAEVHKNRSYRANDRVVSSWATSFVRLIANREVKLIETAKTESARRRHGIAEKERRSFRMVPVPAVKEFVKRIRDYEPNRGGNNPLATRLGAWWVRGHWRFLRDGRYERNDDGSLRRVWVVPHVKGRGRMVEQTWVLK